MDPFGNESDLKEDIVPKNQKYNKKTLIVIALVLSILIMITIIVIILLTN